MHLSTHFWSKQLHKLIDFFFYGIDMKWKCWHKTCMFSASSKCQYLKVGNKSMRYVESCLKCACDWADRCHSSTNPDQKKKSLSTTRLGRKLHFSTLISPELIRAAWITLNGWSVPHAHSWGISSNGTF